MILCSSIITLGKGPKRLKYLKLIIFFVGFSTPPCWPRSQSRSKSIGYENLCGTLTISCNSNISSSFTYSKTWGIWPKQLKKYLKMVNFCRFEHSSLLTSIIRQILKPIRYATPCSSLIMSCNSNKSYSLICPKTSEKSPKRLKHDHSS